MVCLKGAFGADETLTPDVAAKLTQCTERFRSRLHLVCQGKRVRLDSLIGILSLDCRRGTEFEVVAEGDDAQAAAEDVKRLLTGE